MSSDRLAAEFIESTRGRIFVLLREPPEPSGRCVIFVPPFAEEMNKSRRQVTETAKLLVARGLSVLLVDLFGTGDSEGDFAEASWDGWKSDIGTAIAWATARGLKVDSLVAMRLGCMLAAQSLKDAGLTVGRTVFWQPVEDGRQYMTQFLRLRVAASMMEADRRETVDELKARLQGGESLEVAGYELASGLWASVEESKLSSSLHAGLGALTVIEVGRVQSAGELSAPGRGLLDVARERGVPSLGQRIAGEPFWTATEIVVNPTLTSLTTESISPAI